MLYWLTCSTTYVSGCHRGAKREKSPASARHYSRRHKRKDKKQQIGRRTVQRPDSLAATYFVGSDGGRKALRTGTEGERKECWLMSSTLTNKRYCLLVKGKRHQYLSYICLKKVTWDAISLHVSFSYSISLWRILQQQFIFINNH